MTTNREMFLKYLVEIKNYKPVSLKKIDLLIGKVEAVLNKPMTQIETASELERAIIKASDLRKRAYNGGNLDDGGVHTKFRMGLACAQYMRWLYGEGLIIRNVYNKNTFRKPPKIEADWLNDEKLSSILSNEKLNIFENSMIRFFLDTALRREEFINVKKKDVDFVKRLVHVPFAKGMKFRTVPFTEKTLFWLELYLGMKESQMQFSELGVVKAKSEYLFSDSNGDRLGYALVGDIFFQISRKVGFRIHAHALRHTAGRLWAEAGINQFLIMNFLGHESADMTAGYIHSTGSKLAEQQQQVYEKFAIK